MKSAYFDCFAGVSGDMILGALISAGADIELLNQNLSRLGLSGFSLNAEKTTRNGISGTRAIVRTDEQESHRHLADIKQIIECSQLSSSVKDKSIHVFETLALAEAKVHNSSPDKIHFHEVGALDAIVDIVGSVIGLEQLAIESISSSPISVGSGFVECRHGKIPVPAPATLELLRDIPIRSSGIEAELATPTGVAILKTLSGKFGPMPPMTVGTIGYGAGSRSLPIPNLLRIVIGEVQTQSLSTDRVELIETNIDDMNPEHFDYLIDRLFDSGALDVWMTPMMMKKNRSALKVSILANSSQLDRLLNVVFTETTTLGVRLQQVERRIIPREQLSVETGFGSVTVKIARLNGKVRNIAPEYDDCRRAAEKSGEPLGTIYQAATRAAEAALDSGKKHK